jgi:hypothetical protein
VKDIPGSAFRETEELKGDIYMTAGQQDPQNQGRGAGDRDRGAARAGRDAVPHEPDDP